MLSFRQVRGAVIGLALCVLGAALPAAAQSPSVQAVDVSVTKSGDTAQATFHIAVTNNGDAAITNASVVFADGVESYVGDVDAHATTTGQQQETRTLDLGQFPTKNVPMNVTLKFQSGDAAVQQATVLVVRVN